MEFKFKIALVENNISVFQVSFEPTLHLTVFHLRIEHEWGKKKERKIECDFFPSLMTKHDMGKDE